MNKGKVKFVSKLIVCTALILTAALVSNFFAVPFSHTDLMQNSAGNSASSGADSSLSSGSSSSAPASQGNAAKGSVSSPSSAAGSSSQQKSSQDTVVSGITLSALSTKATYSVYHTYSSVIATKYEVGYYTSWSRYSGFTPLMISAGKLTHIHYAFADINTAYQVVMSDSNVDLKNFQDFQTLKAKYPGLKTIISVGGWDNSQRFSDAAATSASREVFAQSCVDFILKYGFDGVDLDWEYPVSGGATGMVHRTQDKQNFTLLIQAIRQKLNDQTAKDSKHYTLTITGAPDQSFINKIELTSLLPSIDYLFIMGYDIHGPWDDYSDFNAPLYAPTEYSPQYKMSENQGILNYINAGASPKKLVLGMPFYGYCYQGVSSANNGLYSTFTSAKAIGYDAVVSGYLNKAGYTYFYHTTANEPYIYGNHTFISYENPQSIAKKSALAKKYGLLGVGAWELSFDRSGTLLTSMFKAFQ